MTSAKQISEAILFLSGHCDGARTNDGAGFSKWDAGFGHDAADRIASGQPVNLAQALRVCTKYRKQLERAGIVLPTPDAVIAETPTSMLAMRASFAARAAEAVAAGGCADPAPRIPGVTVTRHNSLVSIAFPYDPALVEIARGLPGRKFDGATKCWTVPATALDAVIVAFPQASIDPAILADVEAKRAQIAEKERAEAARLAADTLALEAILPTMTRPLFEHQDSGARWLVERCFAILADDMGLGKSLQALVAARALGHRVIVVAPAGLRINWLREAEMAEVAIEIYSWAKVPEPIEEPYTLIGDECHFAQNLKAARTKKFLALAARAQAVFALTGTPIKNGRPVNLFPLLVATRHSLASDKSAYERRYCNAGPTQWSRWDTTGAAHLDELHRKISDGMLRRMKSECLDLPEKIRVTRKAELSEEARNRYETVLHEKQAEYRARKARGECGEADTLVLMNHLRHAGSIAKVESAVEMAEEVLEQGGQVVLFTAFTDSAAQIADALGAGRITGAEDAEQRQTAIDAFQDGKLKSMVCTLGAGGVGITLTAAQTVILVDRDWTPGQNLQCEDRLHRIGQRGSVLAVWLQANGADEAIDQLLQAKNERIELVLSGKRKTLRGVGTIAEIADVVLG